MEEFIPNDPEIADSGSHFLPVFCGWIQGKHNARGKKAIIKINGHFKNKNKICIFTNYGLPTKEKNGGAFRKMKTLSVLLATAMNQPDFDQPII